MNRSTLYKLTGISPGEGGRTFFAALYSFLSLFAIVIVKSTANALFLSRNAPENLPFLYMAEAVLAAWLVVPLARVFADPFRRISRHLTLAGAFVVLTATWFGLRGGLALEAPFYIFGTLFATLISVLFWGVAGEIFTVGQGKRLYRYLALGGAAGSVAGGLFVQYAVNWMGTANQLLIAALLCFLCLVIQIMLLRQADPADHQVEAPRLDTSILKFLLSHKFPRNLALFVFLTAVISATVDYCFRIEAAQSLTEGGMTRLFGQLNMLTGIIAALFHLLLTGLLLGGLGIFQYMALIPAGMIIIAVGAGISNEPFSWLYILKIVEDSMTYGVLPMAIHLLHNPFPPSLKPRLRAFISGSAKKLGFMAGGALLLLAQLARPDHLWSVAIPVLLVLCLFLLYRLRINYVEALEERLGHLHLRSVDLELTDRSTKNILLSALDGKTASVVLRAMQLLYRGWPQSLRARLEGLLEHPEPEVRRRSMQIAAELKMKSLSGNLLTILSTEKDSETQMEAAKAILVLDRERAPALLAPYLAHNNVSIRVGIALALWELDTFMNESVHEAVLSWLEHIDKATAGEKLQVVHLIGTLGSRELVERLMPLLKDPDRNVRKEVYKALGRLKILPALPRLMKGLADRRYRFTARKAIVSYGDEAVPLLREWLDDQERPLPVRLRIPRILRLIGTGKAAEALLKSNIRDDASLRYRIVISLARLRRNNPKIKFDAAWVREAIDRRSWALATYSRAYRELLPYKDALHPLLPVLRDRLEQNHEALFTLMGLIYSFRVLVTAHHALMEGPRDTDETQVQEMLQSLLSRDDFNTIKGWCQPLNSLIRPQGDRAATPLPPAGTKAIRRFMELLNSRDVLLKSTAVYAARKSGIDEDAEYPVVKEGRMTDELIEKALFLESIVLFSGHSVDDLAQISVITQECLYKEGDTIYQEGERSSLLYIIAKGRVGMYKEGEFILELGEKESIGTVSFLDRGPHPTTAVAATECLILTIDRGEFMELVLEREELLNGLLKVLAQHLRSVLDVAVDRLGGKEVAPNEPPVVS